MAISWCSNPSITFKITTRMAEKPWTLLESDAWMRFFVKLIICGVGIPAILVYDTHKYTNVWSKLREQMQTWACFLCSTTILLMNSDIPFNVFCLLFVWCLMVWLIVALLFCIWWCSENNTCCETLHNFARAEDTNKQHQEGRPSE